MNQDLEKAFERDERALEKAASALNRLADVAEKFYAALFPEKKNVRDAKLTTVRTPEQAELAATIQGEEETLEEWEEIGPREKAFLESTDKKKSS